MSQHTLTSAEYRKAAGLEPPGADRARPRRSEAELHRDVARYFSNIEGDLFAAHVPNGEKRSALTAAILVGMGVRPGVADFFVLLPNGRSLWIELKTEEGRLSPAQRTFCETCNRLGHAYRVCRTVQQVYNVLRDVGAVFRESLAARALREAR